MSFGFASACMAASVDISIGSVKASQGQTFSVDVSAKNVPSSGINTMDFAIQYDKDAVELTDVKPVGDIAGADEADEYGLADFAATIDNESGYAIVTLAPINDNKSVSSDGAFITLTGEVLAATADNTASTFKIVPVPRTINPDSDEMNTEIVFAYFSEGDFTQTDYTANTTEGEVTVVPKGDVDKDGDVDSIDAVIKLRYVAEKNTVDMSNADCDGISGVDMRDVIWILNNNK